MDLEAYELVILRRPMDAATYDDDTLDAIQRDHLAYLGGLRDAGIIVANGPVDDQPDESLRGLTFSRTGSLEEARRLAEQDPAVRARRLAVEIMTWLCPAGTMTQPGRRVANPGG